MYNESSNLLMYLKILELKAGSTDPFFKTRIFYIYSFNIKGVSDAVVGWSLIYFRPNGGRPSKTGQFKELKEIVRKMLVKRFEIISLSTKKKKSPVLRPFSRKPINLVKEINQVLRKDLKMYKLIQRVFELDEFNIDETIKDFLISYPWLLAPSTSSATEKAFLKNRSFVTRFELYPEFTKQKIEFCFLSRVMRKKDNSVDFIYSTPSHKNLLFKREASEKVSDILDPKNRVDFISDFLTDVDVEKVSIFNPNKHETNERDFIRRVLLIEAQNAVSNILFCVDDIMPRSTISLEGIVK